MTAVIIMGVKMSMAAGCFVLMGKAMAWYNGEKGENNTESQGGFRDGRVPRKFPR